MKSNKVKNIINESEEKSILMCKDLSMAQFSYNEVIDLFKMSNLELGYHENHNLSACIILLDFISKNTNVIDLPRCFYPDEVSYIVEITELNSDSDIKESIKKFKENH
jgi:hypothetical protein